MQRCVQTFFFHNNQVIHVHFHTEPSYILAQGNSNISMNNTNE